MKKRLLLLLLHWNMEQDRAAAISGAFDFELEEHNKLVFLLNGDFWFSFQKSTNGRINKRRNPWLGVDTIIRLGAHKKLKFSLKFFSELFSS